MTFNERNFVPFPDRGLLNSDLSFALFRRPSFFIVVQSGNFYSHSNLNFERIETEKVEVCVDTYTDAV